MTHSAKTGASERAAGKLVARAEYRAAYDPLQGFESVCTLARQRRNLAFLAAHGPRHILEVGCGALLLARMQGAEQLDFDSWTIVEPEPDFVAAAGAALDGDDRFQIVPGYLEQAQDHLRQARPQGFDAVLLSSVLHETSAAETLLAAAVQALAPGGHLLASVPNARSFHRLLAVEAGLIPSPQTPSERDRALGHPVVFDAAGLTALLSGAGLADILVEGILFKPLTHAQMDRVLQAEPPHLRAALVEGLIALGPRFADQAAEICATGRKPL